jgi:hypothetical protein
MDGVDPNTALCALNEAFETIRDMGLQVSPAHVATRCIRQTSKWFRTDDPFQRAKQEQNALANRTLDELRSQVLESDDSLKTALLMSASGNIIDLGTADTFDFHGTLKRNLERGFALDDYGRFLEKLEDASTLLLVADNCGEVVFDAFFLKLLPDHLRRIMAVKSGPVLNDVTVEDLKGVDIEGIEIMETGSDGLGVLLDEVSEGFRDIFEASDLVIAKGHANFETLDWNDREVFLLLQVKCSVVAGRLGVSVGDTVFVSNRSLPKEA